MLSTSGWLKLTAANGLDIPYLGYLELEMDTMGIKIPDCGFLVVENPESSQSSLPAIIGMNIISRCRQLVQAEFVTTLDAKLDSDWRTVFQQMHTCDVDKTKMARIAGKDFVHVPAESVVTVMVRGFSDKSPNQGSWLLEPGKLPLPGGIVVMPSLVKEHRHQVPVQVVNLSREDVWLNPRTRIGVLSPVQCITNNQHCEVTFQCISANTEQVSVDLKESQDHQKVSDILSKLDIGGTEKEQAELRALLGKYSDVFAVGDDELGYTEKVKHEIVLVDDTPVNLPYRRIPPTQYKEVKDHISQLLRKGVIQESTSSYASPVVVVRKSDGSIRLCVDYRKLNLKTKRDAFPLPRIDESFDALRGAKFFSSIDLASGYHQVAVHERDRHKTAFTTPYGLYEHLRMPMGVVNGPATFQRLMQATMTDLIFQIILVYLDDILVFSRTSRLGRSNKAADALSRHPLAGEPNVASEDLEYDGCVAICNLINKGTTLGQELVDVGLERCDVRQIRARQSQIRPVLRLVLKQRQWNRILGPILRFTHYLCLLLVGAKELMQDIILTCIMNPDPY
ncbi:uncharacterized protein LOC125799454 [Astyanax mexicanus]|uniref:uncharacterized protein LOC125799454 n=1 Tax=Astyanax mexicanus TaxID=7994 RepID=UPI0020CAE002|nr:uncharacterized protein LOC125799454 [Astyanax mexicanus]